MTAPQARKLRTEARFLGYSAIVASWLLLTAATLGVEIPLDGVPVFVVTVIGTGLILWGSFKTKVEKLEEGQRSNQEEIEKRLSREVFIQFHGDLTDRLERIERKVDAK